MRAKQQKLGTDDLTILIWSLDRVRLYLTVIVSVDLSQTIIMWPTVISLLTLTMSKTPQQIEPFLVLFEL